MSTNSVDFDRDDIPDDLRQKVIDIQGRIRQLEEELADSRRELMLCAQEMFARQPLPFTEEELIQIVAEERGVSLEALLEELEQGPQA
jgi:hypothetical protein